MAEKSRAKTSTVTIDIGMNDLLDMVSKSGSKTPIEIAPSSHSVEGEDLKKAWFKHVLISMEKLNDQVEDIRREDIVNIRTELKANIEKLEKTVEKVEDELKAYKKDIIDPLSTKVLTLTVKIGIWSVVAGFVGSGVMGILLTIVKEYLSKSAK